MKDVSTSQAPNCLAQKNLVQWLPLGLSPWALRD